MDIVRHLDERLWRQFVDLHPQGNIFHTPEMFQVFAHTRGHHPTLWAAVSDEENVLALLLPVQITLWSGPLRYLTSRAVVYGGALCAPSPEGQEGLAALLRAYRLEMKSGCLFTELRNLSDSGFVQPILANHGFAYQDHLNFIVNLRQSVKDIWKQLDSNARSNVKKAEKKGVTVEEARALQIVPQMAYALLKEVYGRIHVPLADCTLFQAAYEILQPQDMIKIFMAQVEDVCIGTSIVLLYKDVAYGWYAGTTMEYSSYKAADLLNWHVFQWGAQNSFTSFDFGGAGRPDEDYGPRKFKAKFGGTLVNYGRNLCVHAPFAFNISKLAYTLMRRLSLLRGATRTVVRRS